MPAKTHHIHLSAEDRAALEKISASNHQSEREKKRARILLLCNSNLCFEEGGSRSDAQVAQELRCSPTRCINCGAARPNRTPDAWFCARYRRTVWRVSWMEQQEAHLVALTCRAPPQGFARWTLRLLRERLIGMEVVDSIAPETIRQTLKNQTLKNQTLKNQTLKKTRSSRG